MPNPGGETPPPRGTLPGGPESEFPDEMPSSGPPTEEEITPVEVVTIINPDWLEILNEGLRLGCNWAKKLFEHINLKMETIEKEFSRHDQHG